MTQWPIDIDDSENIARAIFSPYHIKNGKIKPQAFQPTSGTDEISVMRLDWIGFNLCKQKAKQMERLTANPPKTYVTLALLVAKKIREGGLNIIDSRIQFDGHADIKLGIKVIQGEPLPPDQLIKLNELKEYLVMHTKLHVDDNSQNTIKESIELHSIFS